MKIYHGSSIGGIATLEPSKSMHGKSYVYFSANVVVATLYTVNALQRPHYWYPYGFDKEGRVTYDEVYPNAFKDFYNEKKGYIYECDVKEGLLENPTQVPYVKLSRLPVKVSKCIEIENIYQQLIRYMDENKLILYQFEKMSDKALECYHRMIIDSLKNEHIDEDSYSEFIKLKMPNVWDMYKRKHE